MALFEAAEDDETTLQILQTPLHPPPPPPHIL